MLSRDEARIARAVLDGKNSAEAIAAATGIDGAKVFRALNMLRAYGHVITDPEAGIVALPIARYAAAEVLDA